MNKDNHIYTMGSSEYALSYNSMSAADFKIYRACDGAVRIANYLAPDTSVGSPPADKWENLCGDTQALTYTTEQDDRGYMRGSMIRIIFDVQKPLVQGKRDILLIGSNEYGHQARMGLVGVEETHRDFEISIDDCVITEVVHFTFTDVELLRIFKNIYKAESDGE